MSNPGVHLVGSVAMNDAESVFTAMTGRLGPWLQRLPDGETGERHRWIYWQREMLLRHPDMEIDADAEPLALHQWDGELLRNTELLRFKAGVDPSTVVFDTGYAKAAIESYATFERLRREGIIDTGVRFQVSLPTPMASGYMYVSPNAIDDYLPAYERALFAALDEILDAIPHTELSIQWDVCQEVLIHEDYFPQRPDDYKAQIGAELVRLGRHVPTDVDLGYHLCYGTPKGEHLVMPTDMAILVELGNAIASGLADAGHRLDFIHMPVPQDRTDTAYFAPLGNLVLAEETQLFLGVIHHDDAEGDQARMAAAAEVWPTFGISTVCGWGRNDPEQVPGLIESHRVAADTDATTPKPPSAFTTVANASAADSAPQINFDNPGDFDRATRGLVAQIDDGRVMLGDHVVFDVARHGFISEGNGAPLSVHPGLWRQAQLNVNHGLFQVADGIWQVRGYDIANITFMAADDGWLVIDPLTNAPSAAAALELANNALGARPVSSIIYTHSHVDHFGGVLGVTSQEAVDAGDVRIIAPEGFLREVVNEFVIAGPIMGRRAAYQFGPLLPTGPRGQVDCGLGSAMGLARSDLIAPTEEISETGAELDLGGIRVVFQNTPDAEAPAEMNFFFPDFTSAGGLLCMAENCTHTLHNLYPIRGAQTRDALAWSKYIHEALLMWGDNTDTMFASHHWPRFGNDDVRSFLAMQRDVYRWMHDQTMRLANKGHVPTEIAEELEMPGAFTQSHVRGYYGTISHNAKSVYNRYLGWYDGNPAHLNPLPPVEGGSRYVEFMGGADAVLARAQQSFDDGDYRWVAEVVNHVVFADPANQRARRLQADALEQLGYQSESATWRNAYLMGAQELRQGSPQRGRIPTRDMANAMTAEQIFDSLGVRFDPNRFPRAEAVVNIHFTDLDEDHLLGVARSAVNHTAGGQAADADVSLRLPRGLLIQALDDPTVLDGEGVDIDGNRQVLHELLGAMEVFTTANIIEP